MNYKIQNIARNLISIRFNSGQTLHIPAGISVEVMDFDVIDNPDVTKLEALQRIAVYKIEEPVPEPRQQTGQPAGETKSVTGEETVNTELVDEGESKKKKMKST